MKTSTIFLVILIITTSTCSSSTNEHKSAGHDSADVNGTEVTNHPAGDHHEGNHHGVSLASWRWNLYSEYIVVCLTIVIAGVLKLMFHHIHSLHHNVPESCVLIVIGLIIGATVYFGIESQAHQFPQFTSNLFFNILLPPIILDSAYNLYDRDFLANLGSVILFAVVGTLINVFFIGYGLFGAASLGLMGSFGNRTLGSTDALIFSSLISAVDPVAVLAIFQDIGVNMGLYFLVFGESLLNDGVTVVLYNTMVALKLQDSIATSQYLIAFFSFFTVCCGGLTIGIMVGWLTAFFLKYTSDTRVIEPLIVFVMSYFSYIMAETVHWSGIISLIACGIAQKRYAFPNISKKSYTTVKYGVQTMSSLSDCIIFLFLGVVTISHKHEWHLGFALWTLGLCTVIRFIGVYSLSAIINKMRIKKISLEEQFILSYGGLRGAVGFSLVTILDKEEPFKNIFLTTTLFIIFFTVFVQGSTIKLVVNKLHINKKSTEAKLISHDVNDKNFDFIMSGVSAIVGRVNRYSILETIINFENQYIKSWLISDTAVDKLALKAEAISVSQHYSRLYAPVVLVHQKKVDEILGERTDDSPSTQVNFRHTNYDESRRTLKKAFSESPYDRYISKNYGKDSPEEVKTQLVQQRDRWRLAISQIKSTEIHDENTESSEKKESSIPDPVQNGEESSSLLPCKDRETAERVRRAYRTTKLWKQNSVQV